MSAGGPATVRSVQAKPSVPVMIFDGDCRFCRLWIERWRHRTGDRVKYAAYQEPWVAAAFPELPREQCERAVQFIDTAGMVSTGASAALRCLAASGRPSLGWWAYQRVPGFAPMAEALYRFVASHRPAFSMLTRLGWGEHVNPPHYAWVVRVFLTVLAVVYGCAFASLWTQIMGLAGSNGVMPAAQVLESLRQQDDASGWARFCQVPTVFWLNMSDGFLQFICGAGTVLSALALAGVAPRLMLALLWFFYLSLLHACPLFLGYQWDTLLLETGLLAVFFAPSQWWVWGKPRREPSRVVLWLLRWLLFRLLFASGCVKLLSGDATWHGLTALSYHYETQPLPTWIGWLAHLLPAWAQSVSTLLMFGVELILPFCVFLPRRVRMASAWPMMGFMALIALTGNYCFFNLLAVALCLVLFDDAGLQALAPARLRQWMEADSGEQGRAGDAMTPGVPGEALPESQFRTRPISRRPAWSVCLRGAGKVWMGLLAGAIVVITAMQLSVMLHAAVPWPRAMVWLYRQAAPFASVNQYGLFAVMTTNRMEIVIEGSRDGQTWAAYEFKHKPGALDQRPGFVAPHQPRLDWQMWFAALGTYRDNPWLVNLCVRLLQGAPEVLRLLQDNPFPDSPPRFMRASFYQYHFTDWREWRQTGHWWKREPRGPYLPAFSLR